MFATLGDTKIHQQRKRTACDVAPFSSLNEFPLARQEQQRLFEKFYRVHKRESRAKGSGLGLAIVKSVAERHGGRAWFTSKEGEGSTFYLSFPLEPVDFSTLNERYKI